MADAEDIPIEAEKFVEDLGAAEDREQELRVSRMLEKGMADSFAGRVLDVKDVRKRFGLGA